jgi:hypothetical protein
VLIRLHARAVYGYVGFLSYATLLEYFANEIDALLSYDSMHYQDYSVNRAPIQRAFRAYFLPQQDGHASAECSVRRTLGHPQSTQSNGLTPT